MSPPPPHNHNHPLPLLPPQSSFKHKDDDKLIRLALHKSPFFTCLDDEQIERFVAAAKLQTYPAGDIVILEGCVDLDDNDNQEGASPGPADVEEQVERETVGTDEKNNKLDSQEEKTPLELDAADNDDDGRLIETDSHILSSETTPDDDSENDDSSRTMLSQSDLEQDVDHNLPLAGDSEGRHGDETGESDHELATAGEIDVSDDSDTSQNTGAQRDDSKSSDISNNMAADCTNEEDADDSVESNDTVSPSVLPLPSPSDSIRVNNSNSPSNTFDDDSITPPPPRSNIKRALYIVRKGRADVWHHTRFNPHSLGPGTTFGEGGFLFGRQHSASIIANKTEPLECWVVDSQTFRNHVLPSKSMSQLFHKYATKKDGRGQYYLTMEEFVQACNDEPQQESPLLQTSTENPLDSFRIVNTYNILSRVSTTKRRRTSNNNNSNSSSNQEDRIYLSDFCLFHLLIARPDPEVDIAFLLMDQRQTGQIFLKDLEQFLRPIYPALDLESQFFTRYFGKDKSDSIRQQVFSQFLIDLQREMGKQAFLKAVEEQGKEGCCLGPKEFVRVIKSSCGWRLPQGVANRLDNLYCHGPVEAGEAAAELSVRAGTYKGASVKEVTRSTEDAVLGDMEQREKRLGMQYFGYGDFLAFQEVLAQLPGIINLIDRAQEIKQGPISPDDFKVANRVVGIGGRLSRRQVEIIFALFDLDHDGFVCHEDTVSVCGVDFAQRLVPAVGRGGALTFAPPPQYRHKKTQEPAGGSSSQSASESLGQISLSAFAGALGIVALYPLDVIKTRLMNQRIRADGVRLYANTLGCFQHVVRYNGFAGLYRGLIPQLLGGAPEKAIKLHVNDLIMRTFSTLDEDLRPSSKGNILLESFAGACAGACQLLVSNPMELSKTRLILQNETSEILKTKGLPSPRSLSFAEVVRDLGFPQIQVRGATACLLRDIPFSAIYFPTYAACKRYLTDTRQDQVSLSDLLIAGTLAAVPSALLTTPCDVIRVRLHAVPRPGEATYVGIRDCAAKIYEKEGINAFFQGALPRVLRIAPQFGISLLAYEQLTNGLGFSSAARPPTNAPIDPRDYRTAFPTSATINPKATDIDGWMRSFGMKPPAGNSTEKK